MDIIAQWHSDAGHEWLEVSKADCDKLGLKEADFSRYSYKTMGGFSFFYYLEGDSDAGFLLEAAEKHGAKIEFAPEYHWGDRANIRDFPRMAGESRLWNAAMNRGAA